MFKVNGVCGVFRMSYFIKHPLENGPITHVVTQPMNLSDICTCHEFIIFLEPNKQG